MSLGDGGFSFDFDVAFSERRLKGPYCTSPSPGFADQADFFLRLNALLAKMSGLFSANPRILHGLDGLWTAQKGHGSWVCPMVNTIVERILFTIFLNPCTSASDRKRLGKGRTSTENGPTGILGPSQKGKPEKPLKKKDKNPKRSPAVHRAGTRWGTRFVPPWTSVSGASPVLRRTGGCFRCSGDRWRSPHDWAASRSATTSLRASRRRWSSTGRLARWQLDVRVRFAPGSKRVLGEDRGAGGSEGFAGKKASICLWDLLDPRGSVG